jgi:hypothetical protein
MRRGPFGSSPLLRFILCHRRRENRRFEFIDSFVKQIEILAAMRLGRTGPDRPMLPPCSGLYKARPGNTAECLIDREPAGLDSPCARRRRRFTVGTKESLRRGQTKETG